MQKTTQIIKTEATLVCANMGKLTIYLKLSNEDIEALLLEKGRVPDSLVTVVIN